MNKKVAAVIAGAALIVGIGACAAEASSTPQPQPDESSSSAPAATPPTDDEAPPTSGVGAPGDWATWPDGIKVTISDPVPYIPGEYAATGGEHETYLTFNVLVKNTGDKLYDPTLFMTSMSADGHEGESVFDDKMGLTPQTALLPGKSMSFPVAFGVQSTTDLVVQVSPGFGYHAVVFAASST